MNKEIGGATIGVQAQEPIFLLLICGDGDERVSIFFV